MACTATQLSWGQGSTRGHATRGKQRGKGKETVHRSGVPAAASNEAAAAFEQLYEQSAPRVLKTLNRITRNREDAEDALQEAFMNAFVHAKDFDGRSSFTTWFTRIAINSALMILRKKRTHPEHPIDDGSNIDVTEKHWVIPDRAANPERLYAQQERETILKAAVGDLRPTIRKAVEIGQLQDRSMRETADALGISVAAAKARLFHARAALRKSRRLKSMNKVRFPLAAFTVRVPTAEFRGTLAC
jgi:RNA polymerase sigma factor (sigma-70 family)